MKRISVVILLVLGCFALRAEQPVDSVHIHYRVVGAVSDDDLLDAIVDSLVKKEMRPNYAVGVSTNMLYDAALIPNIGIEIPVGSHLTMGADWMYAWWKNSAKNRHWRICGGDLTLRWYFGIPVYNGKRRPLGGHHIGIYGQILQFQIAFGGKGYIAGVPGQSIFDKPYLGGGLEYGYSMRVSHRLNIDFSIGVGCLIGEYRTYRSVNGRYVWESTHDRNLIGPTRIGISLVWLIGRV